MKKLLYITDKFENEQHSAIDSIFNKFLKKYYDISLVYFTKKGNYTKELNRHIIPYHERKHINRYMNLAQFDILIVRNHFEITQKILKYKNANQKVGMQISFPHSFRRYYEAKVVNRSIFRKAIEYNYKSYIEKSIINRCDFYLPISQTMIDEFYKDTTTPYMILPLGIDPNSIIKPKESKSSSTLKIIYIGTIDKLRRFDMVIDSLIPFKNRDWILDIYSMDRKNFEKSIKEELREKITYKGFLPRDELLKRVGEYDIGMFLLPESRLYKVASPTKVMEYYQMGIPAIMSYIPECEELFDESCGFFAHFNTSSIEDNFKRVLNTPKSTLIEMGRKGQERLIKSRNYKTISDSLYSFLEDIK